MPKKVSFLSHWRPSFWMSVCVGAALLVLIALGSWQIQRLGWKQDLIATIETRMASDPVPLPTSYDPSLRFQPVSIKGNFVENKHDLLFGRLHKGKNGFMFLQPFRTEAGQTEAGRLVLVNRGWVAENQVNAETWPNQSRDQGALEIVGILRSGQWEGSSWFRPVNSLDGKALSFIEPEAVAKRLSLPDLEPFYLDLIRPQNQGDVPLILATSLSIPNNHLQYAITWFAFALILIVIFVLRSRRVP